MKRGLWLIVALALLGILASIYACRPRGITVTIINPDKITIGSLALHVTGHDYPLGDLAAGATVKAKVAPTGESHLEITYRDEGGKETRRIVDCYFETGYSGTIEMKITTHGIADYKQNIHTW